MSCQVYKFPNLKENPMSHYLENKHFQYYTDGLEGVPQSNGHVFPSHRTLRRGDLLLLNLAFSQTPAVPFRLGTIISATQDKAMAS